MPVEIISTQTNQPVTQRIGALFKRVSAALTRAVAYYRQNNFADVRTQVTRIVLRKADAFVQKLPLPAVVKQNITPIDAVVIIAAWAIPCWGTAMVAGVAIVGGKLGYRRWRSRVQHRAALAATNG